MSEERDPNQQPIIIDQPELSMKWHKFLVNFALWLGAAISIGVGILWLTRLGSSYDEDKALVAVCAIAQIALGIYGVKVRFDLALFKKSGPRALFILYIVTAAVTVLFLALTGETLANNVGQVIAPIGWAFVNRQYYNKRDHLFVN